MFLQPTHRICSKSSRVVCPCNTLHMQNQSKQFGVPTTSAGIKLLLRVTPLIVNECYKMGDRNLQNMFCCFSPFHGCALAWGPGNPADFVLVHPRADHGKADLGHTDVMVRAVQLREWQGSSLLASKEDKKPWCFPKSGSVWLQILCVTQSGIMGLG